MSEINKVFVGSSEECATLLKKEDFKSNLESELGPKFSITYWTEDDIWKNGFATFDNLDDATLDYSYAILFGFPDDKITVRKEKYYITRDNVIFELGMFANRLGKARTFFCEPKLKNFRGDRKFKIPSDFAAIQDTRYDLEGCESEDSAEWKMNISAVVASISKSVKEEERRNEITLEVASREFDSVVSHIFLGTDLTTKISKFGRDFGNIVRLKSITRESDKADILRDFETFLKDVDDIVSIDELTELQSEDEVKRVWVYAAEAIEFTDERASAVQNLRDTVAKNIMEAEKKYVFFQDSGNFDQRRSAIDKIRNTAKKLNYNEDVINEKLTKNLDLVYLPTSRFMTNFCLHFNERSTSRPFEAFMFNVKTENRAGDVALRLQNQQMERLFEAIEATFIKAKESGVPYFRL